MSDFFNLKTKGSVVCEIRAVQPKLVKANFDSLKGQEWNVESIVRGKETKLVFSNSHESKELLLHFYKGGVWEWYESLEATLENPNYDRDLRFSLHLSDGSIISHQDQFHQSHWKWGSWGHYRSPDIVLEHNAYRRHIYELRHHYHFEKPIYQIMVHPWFFNGINNLTRSEILCRTRFSPFTPGTEILKSEILREDLFTICKEVLEDVYRLGGAQLGLWKNPFGVDSENFKKWIRVYKVMDFPRLVDDKLRVFYFDKRWEPEFEFIKLKEVEREIRMNDIFDELKFIRSLDPSQEKIPNDLLAGSIDQHDI